MAQSMEDKASKEANVSTETPEESNSKLNSGDIAGKLSSIDKWMSEISTKLDASEVTRKELADCTGRITQAEGRLSKVADGQAELQKTVKALKKRNKVLEDKVVNMETRSRQNNVRLVNFPEGAEHAEGRDPCSFLEGWIPEVLGAPQLCPIVIERVQRVGPKKDNETAPRTLIMRFLNYKQKVAVMKAAKAKKDSTLLYENQQVRFFDDLATEVHRQRRQFESVHQQLRDLGLRHGMIPPAKMLITYKDETFTFDNPTKVQDFINEVKEEAQGKKNEREGATGL